MSKMARDKGKRGERAVIDWLQPIVDSVYTYYGLAPVLLQRNTVQSDRGGSDLVGLDWLAAEVKNVENDSPALVESWWQQTTQQAAQWSQPGKEQLVPVLFYTRNRRPIRVRMPGFACASMSDQVFFHCVVDIAAEAFGEWFERKLRHDIETKFGTNDRDMIAYLAKGGSPCG